MKFAMMELKWSLIRLLTNYEILRGENTPDKLEFVGDLIGNLSPKNGISVILKARKENNRKNSFVLS